MTAERIVAHAEARGWREADFESAASGLAVMRRELSEEPPDPGEVLECLETFADRKGVELPPARALELDVRMIRECLGRSQFRTAFLRLWRDFRWPRIPEVRDFVDAAADLRGDAWVRLAAIEAAEEAARIGPERIRRRRRLARLTDADFERWRAAIRVGAAGGTSDGTGSE